MHTEAAPSTLSTGISVSANKLASLVVAIAMLAGSIVFSEPAIADALMTGVIVAIPVFNAGRAGPVSLLNFAVWSLVVCLGLVGTMMSINQPTAITHQLVTLFLLGGGLAMGAYVAKDPVPRFALVMWCYLVGCVVATAAAIAGYFSLLPGAYDLFTNFGRARGTFKDPNVYGAALVPALSFLTLNILLRGPMVALGSAALFVFLSTGLLLSFSRGAWGSAAVSVSLTVLLIVLSSRRKADFKRLGSAGITGALCLMLMIFAISQVPQVQSLLSERASLDQSYDSGPDGRFGGQNKAGVLILDNPFGIGTHTFRDKYHHEEPHNVVLSMFLNAGWLGGVLYLISVIWTALLGLQRALWRGPLQSCFFVIGPAFLSVALEGLIIDSDHWRHFFLLMGLTWGLSDAHVARNDGNHRVVSCTGGRDAL